MQQHQGQQYQGKAVRSQREAKQGDPGFSQGQDQIVITLEDGTEKVVRRSELQQGSGSGGQPGQR